MTEMTEEKRARLLKPPSRLWLVLSAALLLAGLGFLGAFGLAQYQYFKSGRYYAALEQQVLPAQAAEEPAGMDFAPLQAVNPDIAAWLEMPGLDLSLPVVQGTDNETYLHTAFDGSESPAGCLFFGADSGGPDALYGVIYGHNLHNGGMFSGLLQYREADFYRENPTFTLYTPEGTRTYRIFSCHSATDTEDIYRTGRTAGADYDAFLQQLAEVSDYDTGARPPAGAAVLTLSTCRTPYVSGLERYVIHAYLEE